MSLSSSPKPESAGDGGGDGIRGGGGVVGVGSTIGVTMLGGFGAGEEGIDDSEVSKCELGITLLFS